MGGPSHAFFAPYQCGGPCPRKLVDHTREPLLVWSGTRLRLGYKKSVPRLTGENFGGSWDGGEEFPASQLYGGVKGVV